jgi:hypothetical protein
MGYGLHDMIGNTSWLALHRTGEGAALVAKQFGPHHS